MFERYTERARRVLFFARHEASQLGASSIAPEHLLLGITREGKGVSSRLFAAKQLSLEDLRERVLARTVRRDSPTSTSIEMAFAADTKRILTAAAAAADRLGHEDIGAEHLLIAVLEVNDPVAAATLIDAGLTREEAEAEIARMAAARPAVSEHVSVTVVSDDVHQALAELRHEVSELRARVERLELQGSDEGNRS